MKLLLEERLRAFRSDPPALLRSMGMTDGMHVADLGAGKGFYTIMAASIVGPGGVVYAVEPDPFRAATIERRVSGEKLGNVKVLPTAAENLAAIPSSTVDIVISMNSVHHFSDKSAAFSEAHRILKPGGKLYVRDVLRNWLTRHGTSREEVPRLPASEFSDKKFSTTWLTLEATFTK